MFRQFIVQLFSDQSQLISLQLDIHLVGYAEHPWLDTAAPLPAHAMSSDRQSYCTTLRRLDIHLLYGSFLEHLVGRLPNLEQLDVTFRASLERDNRSPRKPKPPLPSNGTWLDKVGYIIISGRADHI